MRRKNPFEDIERMLERMSEQFDEVSRGDIGFARGLDVDVEDRPDEFVVTADLPGFGKEDIDVELVDDTLRIAAEHESDASEEEPGRYVRRERSRESVSRSISLPEAVEEDGVEARFKNGVLTVTLPKAYGSEDAQQIDIE
ncbi:MAG: Hsp20/alpha crystallin family protein [Halanaeroarchaeum sp.]